MPPHGLWPIPRHHLYSGTTHRPTFNAQEFATDANEPDRPILTANISETNKPEPRVATGAGAAMNIDGAMDTGGRNGSEHGVSDRKRKKAEKRADRVKRKEEKLRRMSNATSLMDCVVTEGAHQAAVTTAQHPAVVHLGSSKPLGRARAIATPTIGHKRVKEEKEKSASKDTNAETNKSADRHSSIKIEKKRKRVSEVNGNTHPTAPKTRSNDRTVSDFCIGPDFVKEVQSAVAGIGNAFTRCVQEPEPEVKKVKKAKVEKKFEKQETPTLRASEQSIGVTAGLGVTRSPSKTQKKQKGETGNARGPDQQSAASAPRKTPIPLPSPPRPTTFEEFHQSPAWKKAVINDLPETPPSLAYRSALIKTPIPLPKLPPIRLHTSVEVLGSRQEPSAPSSTPTSAQPQRTYESTAIATKRLKQPLTDGPKPKPKPRAKRGRSLSSSSAASSHSSSVSIADMFARAPKAHAKSDRTTSFSGQAIQTQKQQSGGTHRGLTLEKFNSLYHEIQQIMNFEAEQKYLNQYQDWQVENSYTEYAFPCLGAGSGCTPKKEGILRISRETDNLSIKKAVAASGGDTAALQEAAERGMQAEKFLKHAIRARIPVPIGQLEGMWTLYCPQYSAHHYDRYGYGARTLTISPIAGFKDKNVYTARLTIPPRSMAYSILTFSVPPHASFRTTEVKTAPEGYTMDLVFLGNGYLKLRVDLNLLLKGKPTEHVGGRKVWMEFLGVNEGAVEWDAGKKEEREKEMRELFAKFGGLEG
ncbi:uncharacterized protein EI97DRAFT_472164 [Westerdykella ornata]|uniref:Uncharacterized protein n=1 Tax=Westerdykella ornata TaxID=318751 RepID=A0A6A6K0X5_WESOR|nr:uncharacterized protein EI97DRAFT_472164 [Westerdykella ornata]KAF2280989.1 hypothetical protein EI97DRAFT_472164 [Westerdykella ornata]